MEIKNLDRFRGKMKWTKISEDGKVLITLPTHECMGRIKASDHDEGYYVEFPSGDNSLPFRLAGVDKLKFSENVLGYNDRGSGTWPWMKSTDDILKVLAELDRLYVFKEPEIEKPKSMEMEHPSIEDIDFTPKKKHYSFNFQM